MGALYELCAPSTTPHSSLLIPNYFLPKTMNDCSQVTEIKKTPHHRSPPIPLAGILFCMVHILSIFTKKCKLVLKVLKVLAPLE